ncbi:CHY zinc finger protein [Aquibacillus salsiterrae]|uniref:CHY zinc finger protein n=1 Tax=Aquibacillus salsiterrae TaxID=2950439 RepID=A0A9X3WBU5_9BACI|nr:CHY zinc finger protein [Aquibacillus salsiterrae]MDC3415903.1 CHY zinc finger protein [Aquibacillus salsiterrae]
MFIHGVKVNGAVLDQQTRCLHYQKDVDIIAIKFKCCQTYYPCYQCHQEHADHPAKQWEKEQFDGKAILCGSCGTELTIHEYLTNNSSCPDCKGSFNPGCKNHAHLYFKM